MSRSVEHWQKVLSDPRLLSRASAIDGGDVTAIAALRRDYSVDEVSVALELTAARAKAVVKFGDRGAGLVADVPGIEQASGAIVADYKAKRIGEALGETGRIVDACCGIGGDSMAMGDAGLAVTAVDRDPLRAWMAGINCGEHAKTACCDVATLELSGQAVHIDPARRNEAARRRAWRIEDYQPGPDVIRRLIENAPHGAIKLSPGVDLDELAQVLGPGEVEFISESGRLVQAVLWTGGLASSTRRATLLVNGQMHSLQGEPTSPPIGAAGRYLFAVDPSVERAGLLATLCEQADAPMLHPMLGLLTSDMVLDSPWLTGFELIERMPWRPKRVRQWLSANDGGIVAVKTRGKACDPDVEQKRLRGEGGTTYTVFVLRFDTKVEALITKRINKQQT